MHNNRCTGLLLTAYFFSSFLGRTLSNLRGNVWRLWYHKSKGLQSDCQPHQPFGPSRQSLHVFSFMAQLQTHTGLGPKLFLAAGSTRASGNLLPVQVQLQNSFRRFVRSSRERVGGAGRCGVQQTTLLSNRLPSHLLQDEVSLSVCSTPLGVRLIQCQTLGEFQRVVPSHCLGNCRIYCPERYMVIPTAMCFAESSKRST